MCAWRVQRLLSFLIYPSSVILILLLLLLCSLCAWQKDARTSDREPSEKPHDAALPINFRVLKLKAEEEEEEDEDELTISAHTLRHALVVVLLVDRKTKGVR